MCPHGRAGLPRLLFTAEPVHESGPRGGDVLGAQDGGAGLSRGHRLLGALSLCSSCRSKCDKRFCGSAAGPGQPRGVRGPRRSLPAQRLPEGQLTQRPPPPSPRIGLAGPVGCVGACGSDSAWAAGLIPGGGEDRCGDGGQISASALTGPDTGRGVGAFRPPAPTRRHRGSPGGPRPLPGPLPSLIPRMARS